MPIIQSQNLVLTALRALGTAKETSYGTYLAPTLFHPVRGPKPAPVVKYIEDKGFRGVAAETFGEYAGPTNAEFSYDLDWYPTNTAVILANILGPDTKTGSVAPYTHTFNLAASQPPGFSFCDYDGIAQRQLTGSMLSEVDFKFTPEGGLTASIKGQSLALTSVVSALAPTYISEPPLLGWEAGLTIGGSADVLMVSFDLSLKRKLSPQWTAQSTQSPYCIWAGVLGVTGKLTFDVTGDTEMGYYLNNTQPATVITLTAPTTGYSIAFQLSKCAFTKGSWNTGKDWLQADFDITGVYNATDAGPACIIVKNGMSTVY
jgi:hypothetical protein